MLEECWRSARGWTGGGLGERGVQEGPAGGDQDRPGVGTSTWGRVWGKATDRPTRAGARDNGWRGLELVEAARRLKRH